MAYRARRFLEDHGISLGDLTAFAGRSRSTWSRLLREQLTPEPEGARTDVEALLLERGVSVPPDLWTTHREPASGSPDPTPTEEVRMQAVTLADPARQHFRLFQGPFDPEAMIAHGEDHLADLYLPIRSRFVHARLVQALTKAGFAAVHGEPGTGKSTLLRLAVRDAQKAKPLILVQPANVERRKITAMHISAEIIRQLSSEQVPRVANLRDAAAARVLREHYQQGQRVALVIDEAHELPDTTVKDLKRFHEMEDGFCRLLAIVLIGQTELASRFELARNHRLREAIIRCELLHLPPLKEAGDVRGYMATRFGWVGARLEDAWEPDAVQELERRLAVHDQQIPVLIGNVANAAMNAAYRRGCPRVTADEVMDVWGMTGDALQEAQLG